MHPAGGLSSERLSPRRQALLPAAAAGARRNRAALAAGEALRIPRGELHGVGLPQIGHLRDDHSASDCPIPEIPGPSGHTGGVSRSAAIERAGAAAFDLPTTPRVARDRGSFNVFPV